MSALCIPDYLDERSKLIVNGYIRSFQSLVSSSFNHIPSEIACITLKYVDDHFMKYRGSYEWKITDLKLLENILTAQYDQKFTSEIFEIGALQWICVLHPNGCSSINAPLGTVCLFAEVLSIPTSLEYIIVSQTIECKQLGIKFIYTPQYLEDGSFWGWPQDTLRSNDLINANPTELSFSVSMKILQVVADVPDNITLPDSGVNNYRKQYNINLNMSSNALSATRTYSDIVGEMFCVYYQHSSSDITLRICGLPSIDQIRSSATNCKLSVAAVQVKWSVIVPDRDVDYSTVAKLGYDTNYVVDQASSLLIRSLTDEDFKENNEMQIRVCVEILAEYDFKGNVIEKNTQQELKQNSENIVDKVNVDTEGVFTSLSKQIAEILTTQKLLLQKVETMQKDIDILKSKNGNKESNVD